MPKCIPCLGKDIKDAIREAIEDKATLALLDKVRTCQGPEAIELCATADGKGKRAPSAYNIYAGNCMRVGKSLKDCAGEWQRQKKGSS